LNSRILFILILNGLSSSAQINPKMPRTFGDAIIHKSHFDYAIEVNDDLPQHGTGEISAVEKKIGKLIAENLVKDGATLQMGIGSIPDAVLAALHNHKDLGIHSEMFANGVVELVQKGCVTNSKKKMHQGRIVGSFLIGDKALYDFVDNNPFIGRQILKFNRFIKNFKAYLMTHLPPFRDVGHRLCEQHQHCEAAAPHDCH